MTAADMPSRGRLAGIDYGRVRIGVAISDAQRRLASPLANYARGDATADAAFFRHLVASEEIVGFVVGLPVHTSGRESELSREARAFGSWLAATTARPVCFYDERYSSHEAEQQLLAAGLKRLGRAARRDMLAAQMILTAYLEAPAKADEPLKPLD